MKIYKTKQRTKEWEEIRQGKLTASNASAIVGSGLENYVLSIFSEKNGGKEERFINSDMQRGIDLEDQARSVYSIETGEEVEEVGFIEMDEMVGCSPDGLVGEHGGIEIKCVNDLNFIKAKENLEREAKKYRWQCQMCLLITKRKWWDLVLYNVNVQPNILIHRFFPDYPSFERLILGIEKGKKMLKELEKINN